MRGLNLICFMFQFGSDINIELNHKKKELRFVFRDEDGYVQKTDISSLSGGEKSYAQVWFHLLNVSIIYSVEIRCVSLLLFGKT